MVTTRSQAVGLEVQDLPVRSRSTERLPNSTATRISDRLLPLEDHQAPTTPKPCEAPRASSLELSSPVSGDVVSGIGAPAILTNVNIHASALQQREQGSSEQRIIITPAVQAHQAVEGLSISLSDAAKCPNESPDRDPSEPKFYNRQDRSQTTVSHANRKCTLECASQAAPQPVSPISRAIQTRTSTTTSSRRILIPFMHHRTQAERLNFQLTRQRPSSTSLSRYRIAKLCSRRRRATLPANSASFIVSR
jgi:hypothetical protein